MDVTFEMVEAVANGIREYHRGQPSTQLVYDGNGRMVSVLPQEYHDNAWYKAVEFGLRKAFEGKG